MNIAIGGDDMKIAAASKELSRGVFWILDDTILAFPFRNDGIGVAKSGNTYNHKKLWYDVKPRGCSKPYNYYPRGRVDISNKGKAIIYMNHEISDDWISSICQEFGIRETPVIRYDYSQHYKCYLDDGWIPD